MPPLPPQKTVSTWFKIFKSRTVTVLTYYRSRLALLALWLVLTYCRSRLALLALWLVLTYSRS